MSQRPISEPMRRLIDALSGIRPIHIDWQLVDSCSYALVASGLSVVITSIDKDDLHPFKIEIATDDGVVLDFALSGKMIPDEEDSLYYDEFPWGPQLALIYQRARESSLGIGKAVDRFLDAIYLEEPF